jgi:hypothetical protein
MNDEPIIRLPPTSELIAFTRFDLGEILRNELQRSARHILFTMEYDS